MRKRSQRARAKPRSAHCSLHPENGIALMPTSLTAYAAVAFTVLSLGSAFPMIRVGLRALAPIPLASARFAIAAILIIAWLVWKRPPRPPASDALRLFLC